MSRTTTRRKGKKASTPKSQSLVQAIQNELQSKKEVVAKKIVQMATDGNSFALRTVLDVSKMPGSEAESEQKVTPAANTVTEFERAEEYKEVTEENADSFPRREPE